jgi:hypothetical protein
MTLLRHLWTDRIILRSSYKLAIDIKRQNRLLKVCYVLATSAGLPRLLLFAAAINSTNEKNKAGGMRH